MLRSLTASRTGDYSQSVSQYLLLCIMAKSEETTNEIREELVM